MEGKYFYRRRLPHLQPPGATLFITYRLYKSIPKTVIQHLQETHQAALKKIEKKYQKKDGIELMDLPPDERAFRRAAYDKELYEEEWRYFECFDDFLDGNLNEPHWLKRPDIAQLVADSIHFSEGRDYTLWAFCVMSNHIHLLVTMLPDAPIVWRVLQNSKKYTAVQANKRLGLSGRFWAEESYDHLVRDGQGDQKHEFERILGYILNNPVKAGLVRNWDDWDWSYCHPELLP